MNHPQMQPDTSDLDLKHAFSVIDLGQISLAKSLLREAGIPVQIRNEGLQNLFGIGSLTFNPVAGEVEFWVREEDLEAAHAIVKGFQQDLPS